MDTIAGYQTTGRRLKGPAADLLELTGDRGQKLTAVCFHPEYREHRGINSSLEVVVRFLEDPMVPDLVELVGRDESGGAFVYPTGQIWAVSDVIRILADLGETAGLRAGLELMHRAGQVLTEAADYGASGNVYSHGGLTPWRLVMRQDGRVLVIGHGLPQVEILMFHEDHSVVPPADSFRYCPPERIHGEEENLSSDLFSLCLIAFEFMTGKPVYDGLVNDIRQNAARGEASRVLFRARDSLPASVRDILGNAMRLEMHDRFETGEDFLEATAKALSSGDATGPSLAEVMRKVSSQMQRRGVVPDSASTVMGTPEEIRAMLDGDDDEVLSAKREAWKPPGQQANVEPPVAEPNPSDASPAGGRRWSAAARRSSGRGAVRRGEPDAPPPTEAAEPSTPESAAETLGDTPRWKSAGPRRSGVRGVRRGSVPSPVEPGQEALSSEPGPPAVEPASGVDIQKVLRSSRVRRPRRARAPVRQGPPGESPAPIVPQPTPNEEISSPVPAGEALADPVKDARLSSADLLASIRKSASRSRASTVDGGSAAGALIEQLVRSSDRRGAPVVDAAPEADAVQAPGNPKREEGGRVRRVRRVRRAPAAPEPEKLDMPAAVVAPHLPKASLPISIGPSPAEALGVPLPSRPPSPSGPVVGPPPVPAELAEETTKPPEASEPAQPPRTERPAPDVSDSKGGSGPSGFSRPPAPIPTKSKSGGAMAFVVRRGPTGKGTRMRLPKAATAAEAIGWLAVNFVPVRTDLTGRLTGWYRLHHGGEAVPPDTCLSDLDSSLPLVLHSVPNEVRMVSIRVTTTPEIRFMAPVGTAVPVVSLVDHLIGWLDLSDTSWTLSHGDHVLQPQGILADLECPAVGVLDLVFSQDGTESAE